MTPDVETATAFYTSLFGWKADATRDDTGSAYTMFRLHEAPIAGMGVMPDEVRQAGVPAHWNCYVTVENAAAAAKRAEELDGQLQMPVIDIEVDGNLVGRMTSLADPSGARLSLWEAGNHVGSGLANVPGTFCWNELCTRDADAAAEFYAALLGWEISAGDAENGYREIKLGDRLNGGILPWQKEMGDIPPSWSTYFAVEDCDAAVSQAQGLGGKLLAGPVISNSAASRCSVTPRAPSSM